MTKLTDKDLEKFVNIFTDVFNIITSYDHIKSSLELKLELHNNTAEFTRTKNGKNTGGYNIKRIDGQEREEYVRPKAMIAGSIDGGRTKTLRVIYELEKFEKSYGITILLKEDLKVLYKEVFRDNNFDNDMKQYLVKTEKF